VSDSGFIALRSAGGLLPVDTLNAVVEGKGLDGLAPSDYHLLPGETLRGEANRAWQRLLGAWRGFNDSIGALPEGDPAIGITRERWLLPLFAELGYGRLDTTTTAAGGVDVEGNAFPVSHLWRSTPIHLLGCGVDLDRRSSGVAGAAKAAPHAMVQELLNRTDEFLWAFLSNGRTLRVLRDNASLVRQAYLEFDLTAIFDGELFSDFVALFLVCHQSRVEAHDDSGPRSCWLETWRSASVAAGTRALDHLRDGVIRALRAFGSGFLRHPANSQLRAALASGDMAPQDYYRSLLRLAYRLLFVFVAEDRNLLHHPDATPQARDRYSRYFSTSRLRRLASRTRSADRHPDLWLSLQLVFDALGDADGLPALGLPYLGGFLFDSDSLGPLKGAQLANVDLLAALRPLSLIRDSGGLTRTIDYRNLDSEELGSVYESLLQLVPGHDPGMGEFRLEESAGNERKTTGSYYTPSPLIASLLDTTLDPLLDDAVKSADNVDAAATALLGMTICDPACGSGHFLVAAARRVAKRLAAVRTGDPEPAPDALRSALRDVVGRCIYGVDLNDLAAELAKVSLWLEALEPGKPLSFLDAKIKVGNALLGGTPALLARGIPDEAFAELVGDDKKHTRDLKKRNKRERENVNQGELFGLADLHRGTSAIAARRADIERYDDANPAGLAARADAWRRLEASQDLQQARFAADAWCAAFVWPKTPGATPAITDAVFRKVETAPQSTSLQVREEVSRLAKQYRFFHWHLEFPDVFTVPDDLSDAENVDQGWTGGFSALLGNPPWEQVEVDDKSFFAAVAPEISAEKLSARRQLLIAKLAEDEPELLTSFDRARRHSAGIAHFVRASGRYPLTCGGRVNLYLLFGELFYRNISDYGNAGVILPTGVVTDLNSSRLCRQWIDHRSLASVVDFVNKDKLFADVATLQRFSLITLRGRNHAAQAIRTVAMAKTIEEINIPARWVEVSPSLVIRMNPETSNVPLFRSQKEATLSAAVYERCQLFGRIAGDTRQGFVNMSTDSQMFSTIEELLEMGGAWTGTTLVQGGRRWVAVLESKLFGEYDTYQKTFEGVPVSRRFNTKAVPNNSASPRRPDVPAVPRYWVPGHVVDREWPSRRDWILAGKEVTDNKTSARTSVFTVFPRSAVAYTCQLVFADDRSADELTCLLANLNSFCFDFFARQKITGSHLTASILRQLPIVDWSLYGHGASWLDSTVELRQWLSLRVAELVFTTYDLVPFAQELGLATIPFIWNGDRRDMLRAELDAAYFQLYGIERDEVIYILDTFEIVRRKDEATFGEYRTKRLTLGIYDAMTTATATGSTYETALDPPPGQGRRYESAEENRG
jgi:Eco57I restriction-modification methylase